MNIPEVKLGIIAVSRDCFPIALSTRRRQNIAAACKKETVQTIQNRFGGFFILDFREQHGNPARAEHRLHVVFADKHLAVGDIVRTGNADQRAIHFDSPFLFSSLFFLSFLPKDSL